MLFFILCVIIIALGMGLRVLYRYTDVGEWAWDLYNAFIYFGIGAVILTIFFLIGFRNDHAYAMDAREYNTLLQEVNLLEEVSSEDYPVAKLDILKDLNNWNATVLHKREHNESLWYDWFIPDEVIETTYNFIEIP